MRRLAPALAVALASIATIAIAAEASARVVAVTRPYPAAQLDQGPVMEDGVVSWLTLKCRYCPRNPEYAEGDDRFEVHVRRPGARARVVATGLNGSADSGPESGVSYVDFYASATHLALDRISWGSSDETGDYGSTALRAGTLDAARRPLIARCYADFDDAVRTRSRRVALSGAWLSYEATPCRSTSTLAVRNLDSGSEWRLAQPADRTIARLSSSGDYVALAASHHVQVLDVARREVRYDVDLASPARIDDLEVAADGSLAVLTDRTFGRCDGRVIRYSPAGEPAPPVERACELVAALPTGTVLVRGDRRRRAIVETGTTGADARTLVRLGRRPLLGADADRGLLTWAIGRCSGGATIHVTRTSVTAAASPARCGRR